MINVRMLRPLLNIIIKNAQEKTRMEFCLLGFNGQNVAEIVDGIFEFSAHAFKQFYSGENVLLIKNKSCWK